MMRQKGLGKHMHMDLDERAKRVALYAVRSRKITRLLLIIPGLVVAFTLFSGVERTPLTGRCVSLLSFTAPWCSGYGSAAFCARGRYVVLHLAECPFHCK